MFEDATQIPRGTKLDCDVIVIGSGAAGIPCAHELARSGKSVILLESGGTSMEAATQSLAGGRVDDPKRHGPLDQYRKRVFGGTTSVWGGRCAPFDGIDFESRPFVPHSGWPISLEDLLPFYEKSHNYTFTGNFDYKTLSSLPDGRQPMIPGLRDDIWLQDSIWRFSLPANYGKEFERPMAEAKNLRVLLHANALQITTDRSGQKVTGVLASSLSDNRFHVTANSVVVAAGGLESTRLLMVSKDVSPNGLGNDYDQLGRYYASHISGDLGEVRFEPKSRNIIWRYEQGKDGVYVKRQLRPREEVQRREELLNFRCILTHPPFEDASHGSGVLSAVYLVKRFFKGQIPPEYSRELAASGYHHVPQHMRNVLLGFPGFVRFGSHWFFKRTLARRKYPSVSLRSRDNSYTLHFDAEQSPNPDSRVLLDDSLDPFGIPRLHVAWRVQSRDWDSIGRYHSLLAKELVESGVGRLSGDSDKVAAQVRESCGVGSHHTGTTRMSNSPKTGVVDRNCQVHGVAGLYIAAPSVFPTASFANPVLTTTALALRLADHLNRQS
jgi:choline dehydrogenase-like flavoprotein